MVAAPLCILHAVVAIACTSSQGFNGVTLYCLVFIAWVATVALVVTFGYSILIFRLFKGKVDHNTNKHY